MKIVEQTMEDSSDAFIILCCYKSSQLLLSAGSPSNLLSDVEGCSNSKIRCLRSIRYRMKIGGCALEVPVVSLRLDF